MKMKCPCLPYVVFVISTFFDSSSSENPQIKISNGELKGIFLQSRDNRTYSAFLGVPYAKPPKRFQLAEMSEPWEGIWDATVFGDLCWQTRIFVKPGGKRTIIGSEDCLFANIYVPGKMTNKNLPVMVFVHGGAFISGGGNEYGANFFMDHDVILVTINYRLGGLGFLSTGDGVFESNLGLKDQYLAFKWIQNNIEAFGGNPKIVCVFGESAGAASAHYLVLSNLTQGLIHHAILQSGTANTPWAYTDDPAKNAFDLGNSLGCNTNSSEELLKCLTRKSAKDITGFRNYDWYMDPLIIFPPAKDPPNSKLVLIPEHPLTLMESGNFNKIPMLITVCKDEGLLFHSAHVSRTGKLREEINEDWLRVLPITLYYNHINMSKSQQNYISSQIKKFYFADNYIGEETLVNLTNMYSDRWFIHGIQKAACLHAKHSTVYNGIVSYQGENSFLSLFGIKEPLGVSHVDDLMYLFTSNFFPKLTPDSADEEASRLFLSIWTQFATTGKPAYKDQDVEWEPFSARRPFWFNLNLQPELLENPFKERIKFWDRIWGRIKYNELYT